jgi:hypothetical protein
MTMTRLIAIVAAGWACGVGTGVEPIESGGHHVLFVGNSLTYTNDLPTTVAQVAASGGDTIRVAAAVGPNLALIDHLNGATDAAAQIARGGWEYVILQQGPTTVGICRDSLVLWTKLFDPRIRAIGAVPALLMTWPATDRLAFFDEARVSFQMAAQAVDGVFMPAGEAWRLALAADPNVGVYGPDGFHPSPIGTFLTALEIYERVTGKDARQLPAVAFAGGGALSISEPKIRQLQAAAHAANQAYPAKGTPPTVPTRATASPVASHC